MVEGSSCAYLILLLRICTHPSCFPNIVPVSWQVSYILFFISSWEWIIILLSRPLLPGWGAFWRATDEMSLRYWMLDQFVSAHGLALSMSHRNVSSPQGYVILLIPPDHVFGFVCQHWKAGYFGHHDVRVWEPIPLRSRSVIVLLVFLPPVLD